VKSAMGMGVNAGVLVSDPSLLDSDVFAVAHILAKAIQKLGMPDLVLTGCVSGDTGHKAVGPLLAQELVWPCVTFVSRVEATAEGRYRSASAWRTATSGWKCRFRLWPPS